MSSLGQMQAGIRDLIKNRNAAAHMGDPYLKEVASSSGFAMLQEIAIWWRAFQLSSYCVFTGKLLKKLGLFDEMVKNFFFERAVSPYIETAGDSFLVSLATHENPLVATMARFERAVLLVKKGSHEEYHVVWDRDPDQLMASLGAPGDLSPAEPGSSYCMTISREIPSLVACFKVSSSRGGA